MYNVPETPSEAKEVSIGGQAVEIDRTLIHAVRDSLLAECWVLDQDRRPIDEMLQQN